MRALIPTRASCGAGSSLGSTQSGGAPPRNSRATRRSQRRAFTLIELLLAMGIFAFVLTAIYSSWLSIMRGAKSAQNAAAAVQRSRVAVRAIEDALLTAQVFNSSPQHYWFVADTKGEYAMLDMVARLPDSFPGSGMYGDQMLRHVSFTVEQAEHGNGNQLVLRQWPLLMPVDRGGAEAKPYEIVIGRDVDLFKMEFYDDQKRDWIDEWKFTNQFPKLVRVAIGMGNPPNMPLSDREIITRVIAPAAIMVPREYQQPNMGMAPPPLPVPGQNPNQPGGPNQNPNINPNMNVNPNPNLNRMPTPFMR
jgi:prepilin-type N-terminal cleavage/methylation domain-containing protein